MNNITYTVVYEPRVLDALTEISFYYAQKGGQELADKMFDNIVMQLDKLEFIPFGCQKTDFCEDIRRMVIKTPPYLLTTPLQKRRLEFWNWFTLPKTKI